MVGRRDLDHRGGMAAGGIRTLSDVSRRSNAIRSATSWGRSIVDFVYNPPSSDSGRGDAWSIDFSSPIVGEKFAGLLSESQRDTRPRLRRANDSLADLNHRLDLLSHATVDQSTTRQHRRSAGRANPSTLKSQCETRAPGPKSHNKEAVAN